MDRTSTPDINTKSAAELSFSHFLHDLESDKAKLTKDLEKSTKVNIRLSQENDELKKQNAKFQTELNLEKKTKWCYICEKATKHFVENYAICSENCLKKLWCVDRRYFKNLFDLPKSNCFSTPFSLFFRENQTGQKVIWADQMDADSRLESTIAMQLFS